MRCICIHHYYFLQSDRIEDQFLGDLGQLVNLDLLSGPPPPKMGGGPSPANPFGTASSNPQQSLNPFEANKPPAPSLNQIAANKQPYGGPSEWTLYSYYRVDNYILSRLHTIGYMILFYIIVISHVLWSCQSVSYLILTLSFSSPSLSFSPLPPLSLRQTFPLPLSPQVGPRAVPLSSLVTNNLVLISPTIPSAERETHTHRYHCLLFCSEFYFKLMLSQYCHAVLFVHPKLQNVHNNIILGKFM